MKKDVFNLRLRSRWLLVSLLALLAGGVCPTWAQTTETFEDLTLVDEDSWGRAGKFSNDWFAINSSGEKSNTSIHATSDDYPYYIYSKGHEGSKSLGGISSSTQNYYLVIPTLISGDITFYCTGTASSYGYLRFYKITDKGDGTYTIGSQIGSVISKNSSSGWVSSTIAVGEEETLIAIKMNRMAIDDFTYTPYVEAAVKKPKNLTVTNITSESADFSWTKGDDGDTAWQIVYSTDANFDKDAATPIDVNTTSYSFSELNPNTTYYVAVRTYAGSGEGEQSAWATTSFKTEKVAAPATGFTDNFETDKGWDLINGTCPNKWVIGTGTNNGGSKSLYISQDGTSYASSSYGSSSLVYASMLLRFEAGDYTVSYDWMCNGESTYDFMRVGLVPASVELTASTSYSSLGSGSTLPTGWTKWLDGGSKLGGSSTWATKSVDFTIETAGNYQVVFAWRNDYSGGSTPAAIDNFKILGSAPVLELAGDVVGTTLDFGSVSETTNKTITITNSGKVAMENIVFTETSDADNVFAYTTLPKTSLDASESMDVTVTFSGSSAKDYTGAFRVSADDCDPIDVTVTATYSNSPATMAITIDEAAVGETVEFGTVNKQAEKTFSVTNEGDQALNITSIVSSNTTDFTVSPATLTVAGGATETFTVTFLYDKNALDEEKTATITITPSNEGLSVLSFDVTGTRIDVWSEDFSGNELPTGWDAGANWSIENGVAKAAYAYGSTSYLTTPTLTVSGTDDVLTFDYAATANYVSIKIQMSKDGAPFADYSGYPTSLNNGDNGTFTITGLEAGDYQFRFASDDYTLDNFEGFKLNLADHICVISGSNIPTSMSGSPTMKVGRSFEATVTVKENRGVAEALTAKVYMDGEVIGTATGNVAANGSETITITCTPTKSGYLTTYIEVEYAGGTLTTTSTYRSVQDLTYLTLDETSSEAIVAGTYDNVTLKRTFIAGWNTVCLPFTISDVEEFFGTGAKAYEFSSFADGSTLTFEPITTLTASYPYIVYVPNAITEDFKLTDITIESKDATAWYTRKDYNNNAVVAYFRGTYAPVAAGKWTKNAEDDIIYGVTTDAKIAKAGETASIDGFRAYFDLGAAVSGARLAFTDDGGQTTYIDANRLNNVEDGKAYNLQGQRVENLKKGLYIINGKKKVVRK